MLTISCEEAVELTEAGFDLVPHDKNNHRYTEASLFIEEGHNDYVAYKCLRNGRPINVSNLKGIYIDRY